MSDEQGAGRRRPMARIGDLLPSTARHLGLEEELRFGRAVATWEAIVAERIPAAAGAARLRRIVGPVGHVETDHPIVAQELRLREPELLAAFGGAPGGLHLERLRVTVRPVEP